MFLTALPLNYPQQCTVYTTCTTIVSDFFVAEIFWSVEQHLKKKLCKYVHTRIK